MCAPYWLLVICMVMMTVASEGDDNSFRPTGNPRQRFRYGIFRGHINDECPPGTSINPTYIGDEYYHLDLEVNDTETIPYQDTLPCLLCIPGTFSSISSAKECQQCPPGTFADRVASTACQPCRPQTFNPFHGQILCKICTHGVVQLGRTECIRKRPNKPKGELNEDATVPPS